MKLRPINDKVVIKRDSAETRTEFGIILPAEEKKKQERGKVLAVGPGYRCVDGHFEPMQLKEGDIVYFSKYAGNEIDFMGEKLLIISEQEVQVVVEGVTQ